MKPGADAQVPKLTVEKTNAELRVPEYHLNDEEVEAMEINYSTRAPEDFVISGPLPGGKGPGRRFKNIGEARKWVHERYPGRVRWRIQEATTNNGNRWAWLIRGVK